MSAIERVPGEIVPTTASLASLEHVSAIVRPVAAKADVVAAFNEYQQLCDALLVSTDYQNIGGKQFRKKSGWRKLAVAFNVTCEIMDRQYERDEHGRIIRAEVIIRATAPNGRHQDGLGACDLLEKCCPPGCKKSGYHTHCLATCDGRKHFSNPQHDIPATAATRAQNRACADLFGMGEVSAEEIIDKGGSEGDHDDQRPRWEKDGWPTLEDANSTIQRLVARAQALDGEPRANLERLFKERNLNWKDRSRASYEAIEAALDSLNVPTGETEPPAPQTAARTPQEPAAAAEAPRAAPIPVNAPDGPRTLQEIAGYVQGLSTTEMMRLATQHGIASGPLPEVRRALREKLEHDAGLRSLPSGGVCLQCFEDPCICERLDSGAAPVPAPELAGDVAGTEPFE